MPNTKKIPLVVVLLIVISIILPLIAFANSAEPPSILIIAPNTPEDLEISIRVGEEDRRANVREKLFERYFVFYSHDLEKAQSYELKIVQGEEIFLITLEAPLKQYNNIFTLDLMNKTLLPGKALGRTVQLVSLRIILTLMLEALVFFFFGFRRKRSWLVFLIVNLLTQGALNIWLNELSPIAGYLIFSLIFAELLIFSFEIIVFLLLVKEHKALRRILYVLGANLLSLIVGGYIITTLPL